MTTYIRLLIVYFTMTQRAWLLLSSQLERAQTLLLWCIKLLKGLHPQSFQDPLQFH